MKQFLLIYHLRFGYAAPLNPRGDTFQKPSSSSTGSAVACAAYPWLDFTVGTDSGGSIRHPAGVCGTYGFRPSLNLISGEGVFSITPLLDTVGIFARSASIMEAAIKAMIDPSFVHQSSAPDRKYRLLYPVRAKDNLLQSSSRWFPYPGEACEDGSAELQFEEMVQKLESHLQCPRAVFDLEEYWRNTRPEGQSGNLDETTGHIYSVLTTYSVVRDEIDPFIQAYREKSNGEFPSFDPIVKARHSYGRALGPMQVVKAIQSKDVFGKWVNEVLLAPTSDDDAKTEFPLLIFPQSWGTPDHRDAPVPGEDNLAFTTFSTFSLSYLSGCPDCTVPVGEVPFRSPVTGREEMLPISLSILSPFGTDLELLALLKDLEDKCIVRNVVTGASMYKSKTEQGMGSASPTLGLPFSELEGSVL